MKNKAQRICKKIFAVLIIVTLLAMLFLPGVVLGIEKSDDDPFLDGMVAAMAFVVLLVLLLHEIAYYNALNYYLGEPETKTKAKTAFFTFLFLENTVLLVPEVVYLLSWF